MKKTIFTGAGVAIVTPMHDDLSINWELLGELIDYQIDNGTDAIVIVGTTGEASTLTDEEHVKAIRYAVERTAGRVPVVAAPAATTPTTPSGSPRRPNRRAPTGCCS